MQHFQESQQITLPPIQYYDPLDHPEYTREGLHPLDSPMTERPRKRRSFHVIGQALPHNEPCQCHKRHSYQLNPTFLRPWEQTSKKKPRWSMEDRAQLIWAIIKDKQLDDLTSFDWDAISTHVDRGNKACKDQWRREILPILQKLPYMNQFQPTRDD